MTWYDRVRRAGNAASDAAATDGELLDALRGQLQEEVPVDKLAKLSEVNPERARNEVRSACRRIFEGADWEFTDAGTRERLVAQLLDAIFGFGVLEDLIADETITEIIVNGPRSVFIEREGKLHLTGRSFSNPSELRALIDRILAADTLIIGTPTRTLIPTTPVKAFYIPTSVG